MTGEGCNKMTIAAAGFLLALAGTPARADQEPGLIPPLETTFAVGALLNLGRASQHYQHYQHYRSQGHDARQPSHGPDPEAVTTFSDIGPENAGSSR